VEKETIRIALAQINCTVGDLQGNRKKIIDYINKAKGLGADIISFPELAITGYPPEDLLLKPKFVQDNLESLRQLTQEVRDIITIVGFVDKQGNSIYNAAAVIYNGKVKGIYHKMHLPNYGVFDEERYFVPGSRVLVLRYGKIAFGVNICEDIWHVDGPTADQAKQGAKVILNINASPYYAGKIKQRENVIRKQALKEHIFISYTNLVGGQDELVFDGQSMVIDSSGKVIARASAFEEDLLVIDLNLPVSRPKKAILVCQKVTKKRKISLQVKETKLLSNVEEVYKALVLGLKDYVTKNGFSKVIIGLSGGIDSSLVAALSVDALGKENVTGLFMPTRYTSAESEEDVKKLAGNLGIKLISISAEQIYKVYLLILEQHFVGLERNIAEENLQARIRGNLLMAFSNKFGWLVLATGNKSEMSTGYATLYGDMAGGFAVIKDVPKMLVYDLARHRNNLSAVIPERVFTKAPTAELKPDQKDIDTLAPYETLDPILKAYVEEDKEMAKIVSLGFDKNTVAKVLEMVDKSEYKRRQAPPGIKITPKAFGRDRRMPITNKYKGSNSP
jgi:NAD+ synthase (glutamine-hydrolysing)